MAADSHQPDVLREMVDFFYRNEVQELIEDLGKAGTSENAGPAEDTAGTSKTPKTSQPQEDARSPDPLEAFLKNPGDHLYRRRFIAHMTLLPTVLLGPNGKPDREAREKVIEKTDPQRDDDWLQRARRRWAKSRWRKPILDWLEKARETRDGWLVFLRIDPIWDGLRDDERFVALVEEVGF